MSTSNQAEARMFAAASGPDEHRASEWQRWHIERLAYLRAPFGPASLIDTAWLGAEPRSVAGITSLWSDEQGAAVGTGVRVDDVLRLEEGAEWMADGRLRVPVGGRVIHGSAVVTVLERDGEVAVRVYAPESPLARSVDEVEMFPYESRWVVSARFVAANESFSAEREQFDGYRKQVRVIGWLEFVRDGRQLRLAVTEPEDGEFAISYGDSTNSESGLGFRFLDVAAPVGGSDETVIDFNRTYLAPCTFSDQFVCPLPLPGNRLAVGITAGERRVLWH